MSNIIIFVFLVVSSSCVRNNKLLIHDSENVIKLTKSGITKRIYNFGNNPGSLAMYLYTPFQPFDNAGLVVAMHGCSQSASDYAQESGWNKLADIYGFYVLYPETNNINNVGKCFNWMEPKHASRDQGEAYSIANMVRQVSKTYSINPSKIFVTGLSAGGSMTNVMLANYPDIFAGGAPIAGLPFRCATNIFESINCMSGMVSKNPEKWGELVRSAYPGYTGPRPRIFAWQGDSDPVVNYKNLNEMMKQWTNVHRVNQTFKIDYIIQGNQYSEYLSGSKVVVKTVMLANMGHGITVDPGTRFDQGGRIGLFSFDKNLHSSYHIAEFWGLIPSHRKHPDNYYRDRNLVTHCLKI